MVVVAAFDETRKDEVATFDEEGAEEVVATLEDDEGEGEAVWVDLEEVVTATEEAEAWEG